ncbi:CGNR zinc finger domain-containing protein [Streptomyces sp. NPDC055025]
MTVSGLAGEAVFPASGRFSTSLAPEELRLSQELANTVGRTVKPAVDLLHDRERAQAWLDVLIPDWCRRHELADPRIVLTGTDLSRLRALRDDLRHVLDSRAGGAEGLAGTAITSGATVSVSATRAVLVPTGTGVTWLTAAVAIECLLATGRDDLRRLKLCRHPECRLAFYDRSKNNSGVWHNTAKCGNPANVRAFRARQRKTTL